MIFFCCCLFLLKFFFIVPHFYRDFSCKWIASIPDRTEQSRDFTGSLFCCARITGQVWFWFLAHESFVKLCLTGCWPLNPGAALNHICKGWIRIPQYSILLNKLSHLTTKTFTAKLKPYLQHGIGVRILPWGEADPGWWWSAPLENTQLGFFGTKTYGLPCLRFIKLLPQFGVWKWSRTDSFWGREEGACKGL